MGLTRSLPQRGIHVVIKEKKSNNNIISSHRRTTRQGKLSRVRERVRGEWVSNGARHQKATTLRSSDQSEPTTPGGPAVTVRYHPPFPILTVYYLVLQRNCLQISSSR
ncbi:hypothetical protein BDW62DRAFT_184192 [Aspergillus aurantiobrunneus]